MPHDRMFPHAHAHKLDDPERASFLPVDEIVRRVGVKQGMSVADVGAGTGYFALPLARAVAPGRVAAIDLQQEMLDAIARRAAETESPPITLVRADASDTTLADGSIDLAFYANVWHEIDDRREALDEAARILRDGGRIAILDWRKDVPSPPGPPTDHRLAAPDVARELERGGWKIEAPQNVGTYAYLVLAERPRR